MGCRFIDTAAQSVHNLPFELPRCSSYGIKVPKHACTARKGLVIYSFFFLFFDENLIKNRGLATTTPACLLFWKREVKKTKTKTKKKKHRNHSSGCLSHSGQL